jgi:hypothetical protein
LSSFAALPAVSQETLTVTLINGDRRSTLRYTTPDVNSRAEGVPFFIVIKEYASLDGKRAEARASLFCQKRTGRAKIYLINADGGDLARLNPN